ncbi:MAG: hypothetical protein HY606_12445 [Planctomycetes bacterium]|nr:hypothetical protein [Planctomycetota bacterium]
MNAGTVDFFRVLTKSLIAESDLESNNNIEEHCSNFVIREFYSMSLPVKLAMKFVILYLNVSCFLGNFRTFRRIENNKRVLFLQGWIKSRLYFKKAFIQLFRNLVLLSYFDHKDVTAKFGLNRDEYLKILSIYSGNGI